MLKIGILRREFWTKFLIFKFFFENLLEFSQFFLFKSLVTKLLQEKKL